MTSLEAPDGLYEAEMLLIRPEFIGSLALRVEGEQTAGNCFMHIERGLRFKFDCTEQDPSGLTLATSMNPSSEKAWESLKGAYYKINQTRLGEFFATIEPTDEEGTTTVNFVLPRTTTGKLRLALAASYSYTPFTRELKTGDKKVLKRSRLSKLVEVPNPSFVSRQKDPDANLQNLDAKAQIGRVHRRHTTFGGIRH